ncbi:MAG: hypothetical protein R6V72_11345, partial [Cyclobacterium sp.]
MKCLLILFLITLSFYSCNQSSSGTGKVEGLEVSIDTVLIATGEDFINLRSGIYFSGLSNDGKYLFNSGG